MPVNFEWLFEAAGLEFLLKEYAEKGRSSGDIARELNTYPKLIIRALIKHNIKRHDKATAQSLALAAGRHPHPTKGTKRSTEVKKAIGQGVKHAAEKRNAKRRTRHNRGRSGQS